MSTDLHKSTSMSIYCLRSFDVVDRVFVRRNSDDWPVLLVQFDVCKLKASFVYLHQVPPSCKTGKDRSRYVPQWIKKIINNVEDDPAPQS